MTLPLKTLETIYQNTRKDYKYPYTTLVWEDQTVIPFFIEGMNVHVNPTMLSDETEAYHIFRHELGHPMFAPKTIANHKNQIEIIQKIIKEEDVQLCADIANVFNDFIVDKEIVERFNDDLEHFMKNTVKSIKKINNGKLPTDSFWWILSQYYNKVIGKDVIKVAQQKEKEAGDKCFEIICRLIPQDKKLEEVTKILNQFDFLKDYQQRDAFRELLKQIAKAMKSGKGKFKENFQTPEERRKALEELIDEKGGTGKKVVEFLAECLGIELQAFDYYKMLARKRIQFKIKIRKEQSGIIVKGGLEPWSVDDKAEELEVEESAFDAGILIPELTTKKFEKKIGFTEVAQQIPSILLILDTSGSMNREKAIITCFSFLEACRHYNTEAGIILFSDSAYYSSDLSKDYDKTEREVYQKYRSGGTSLAPPAQKTAEILSRKTSGSLVLFISDLEAYDNTRAYSILRNLMPKHQVVFITIDSDVKVGGFVQYFIQDLSELDNLIVENVNNYVGV